ncbi:hypothetical protein BLX87_13570 [Bacillus sp. VT-16-64]|nr:hypothetical protein BLX87_13570 [Bacillus sp. VT-16-64]
MSDQFFAKPFDQKKRWKQYSKAFCHMDAFKLKNKMSIMQKCLNTKKPIKSLQIQSAYNS